jgi:hypothetical protein
LDATDDALEQPECDVVLTIDHEYYVLRGVCIAVRERSSGRYVRQNLTIGIASIHTGQLPQHVRLPLDVKDLEIRERVRSLPRTGEWLCLERGGALHYVGPVTGCERRRMPSRRIVSQVMRRARLD